MPAEPALNDSLGRLTGARRGRAWLLGSLFTTLVAIATGYAMGSFERVIDVEHYERLAQGLPVMMPFASRQLAPLLVRAVLRAGLALHLQLSVETGFVLLGLLSLPVFAGAVTWLVLRSGAPLWMLTAILGLWFWGQQFNGLILPDLPYAALLALLLLLLWRRAYLAAALLLFPLAIAREATILLLVCLLAAGWKLLRWRDVCAAVLSLVAGLWVVKALSRHALENREHISPAVYMLAKMPWNGVRNVFGIIPWANVFPACPVPVAHYAVHLGPLRDLGYCSFDPGQPMQVLASALASFGLLPLLLWRVRKARLERPSLLLRFCVLYGVLSYLMAPLLGASFTRLFGYGWPAFFVALPLLSGASREGFRDARLAAAFVVISLLVSWSGWRLYEGRLLLAGGLGWGLGWWILHVGWGPRETATS